MGFIQAIADATTGTFADQWKDIITAGSFDEHTAVAPGLFKQTNNGRGVNYSGSLGVITNGSKIFVPENTAAFIFSQSGIENVITSPGGYEYTDGEDSVVNGNSFKNTIVNQVKDRFTYGGQTVSQKQIAFVNLREIRDIKFGTRGPLIYNDSFYGTDLEVLGYGTFSLIVRDPIKFIRNYIPPNTTFYTFDDKRARAQILAEFLQSFTVALNSLSQIYRISQLPSQANEISEKIATDPSNAGTWNARFGFEVVKVGITNIEFSPASRELVRQYSSNKMSVKAYEDVSQQASNIAAQQQIARGIQDNGLGDGAGMFFGMNMAQNMTPQAGVKETSSINEQIENVKKLKDLLDAGILTQDEFDSKKKEIMGL